MSRQTRFLDACWRRPVDRTPIWIMRQAGRYLPNYRAIRKSVSFLDLCRTPDLAAEVTCQPVEEIGVDAAIIFSDIMIPAIMMGLSVDFDHGPPHVSDPIRSSADVERLQVPDPEEAAGFVMEAIRLTARSVEVPVIGFAAAPFTLATYMIEGGPSRHYERTKAMALGQPALWRQLVERIAETTTAYLSAQVAAGASAIQLFDTWAGVLGPADFVQAALPGVQQILSSIDRGGREVPLIYFPRGCGAYLHHLENCGADVIGLDWTVDIGEARRTLGDRVAVQGNLDPTALFLPQPEIERRARLVLEAAGPAPGHVFNLGHGILPQTPPENARFLVDTVHQSEPDSASVA